MYATTVYDVTPLYNPNVATSTGDVKGDVITPEASFLPWDNPDNIISYVTYQEIDKLVTCAVVPPLFLLGLVTNLINCVVFWRQGLKDRMNLCLFSLAVADMLFVLCLFLMVSYCVVTELGLVTDDTWKWYVRRYTIGPTRAFLYCSACLTTIIAVERCVCVTFPLKAASLMRTRTMAALIVGSAALLMTLCSQYTLKFTLRDVTDPVTGHVSLTMVPSDLYIHNEVFFDGLENVVLTFVIPISFLITVTIATALTVVKLRGAASWRRDTSNAENQNSRLVALTQMLVIVSCVFILCSLPNIMLAVVRPLVPDFWISGRYANLYYALHLIGIVISVVNSSVNFFVYFARSSRFRQDIYYLFKFCSKITTNGRNGSTAISKVTRTACP